MADFDTFVIQLCVMNGKQAGKPQIDEGSKCLLPAFVLQEVSARRTPYPITFELFFPHNGRSSHLGVLDFTASEGTAVVPEWVMTKFHCRRLAHVQFRTVALPSGNFLRIQPQQKAFVDLANPKLLLQNHLQEKVTAITNGDVFHIHYLGNVYAIKVMEVRSRAHGKCPAIRCAQANVNDWTEIIVEFDRPADMPQSPTRHTGTSFPTTGGNQQQQGASSSAQSGEGGLNFDPNEKQSSFAKEVVCPGVGGKIAAAFSDGTAKTKFEAFAGNGTSISGGSKAKVSADAAATSSSTSEKNKKEEEQHHIPQGRTLSGKVVPIIEEKKKEEEETSTDNKKKEEEKKPMTAAEAVAARFGSGGGRTLGGSRRQVASISTSSNANAAAASATSGDNNKNVDEPPPTTPLVVGHTLSGKVIEIPGPSATESASPVTPTSTEDKKNDWRAFGGGGRKLT